jgi:hypothetical protein
MALELLITIKKHFSVSVELRDLFTHATPAKISLILSSLSKIDEGDEIIAGMGRFNEERD